MKASKSKAACGQASGGAKKGDVYGATMYQYTPKVGQSQIWDLLDRCLENYRRHRARFVATGDPESFRLALAAEEDRQALLRQHFEEGA